MVNLEVQFLAFATFLRRVTGVISVAALEREMHRLISTVLTVGHDIFIVGHDV